MNLLQFKDIGSDTETSHKETVELLKTIDKFLYGKSLDELKLEANTKW